MTVHLVVRPLPRCCTVVAVSVSDTTLHPRFDTTLLVSGSLQTGFKFPTTKAGANLYLIFVCHRGTIVPSSGVNTFLPQSTSPKANLCGTLHKNSRNKVPRSTMDHRPLPDGALSCGFLAMECRQHKKRKENRCRHFIVSSRQRTLTVETGTNSSVMMIVPKPTRLS